MANSCRWCGVSFSVTPQDIEYLKRFAPTVSGKRLAIPHPRLCPDCRQQRRYAFRNDQYYYRTKCSLCNKGLISIYSPDVTYPIACRECFWSDGMDPLAFGQEVDFTRPFFEQFAELRSRVPRIAVFHTLSENSDYTVHSARNKNCYMSSSMIECEDVYYSDFSFSSKDCMDLFSCQQMELCYQCVFSEECFDSDYLENCTGTNSSYLCFDCRGSDTLIGCVGVRKGKNLILNQPASAEECRAALLRLKTDRQAHQAFEKEFVKLCQGVPKRESWQLNTEDSTGNYLTNCRRVANGYNVRDAEDLRYGAEVVRVKDCCDVSRMGDAEVMYECNAVIDSSYSAFSNLIYQCNNLIYCDNCQAGTANSFGCMSLKGAEYCVLNKAYSQEDYARLVPRIVAHMEQTGEWGEFFPPELSPFGYNQTKSAQWFPLAREQVQERGWKWSDYESPQPASVECVDADHYPDDIRKVSDGILDQAIRCEVTGKLFKLISPELAFYRRKSLPVPRCSPQERHLERVSRTNDRHLWKRFCEKCSAKINSIYPPDRPDIVYCDRCYYETVY